MVTAMASVTVAAGVQTLPAVSATRHAHLASASRLGGSRVHTAGIALRPAGRSATVVVRAGDSVPFSRKVQDAVGGLKNFFSGKASDAKKTAQDASRDAQNRAQKLGDQAADAGRDLEGSVRNASRDLSSDAQNLGGKAQNALDDAGDSLKREANKATSAAQDAGDAARDTAQDLKRDVQKGADRL